MSEEDSDTPDSIPLSDLRSDIESGHDEKEATELEENGAPGEPSRDEPTDSIPLSGLRDAVSEGRKEKREGSDTSGAFFQENVDSVDTDGIWADLLMEDGVAEGQFEPEAQEQGVDGPTQIISKRICERCRYVTEPPELSCTHEGTRIHELVDVDHVRVEACPMVGPDGEKKGQGPPEADES